MSLFIAIAGNIGTGKTSLSQMIGKHLGCDIFYETVENNPYLSDFYLDMKRWGFNTQVFFLSERFKAHQEIVNSGTSCVQDRTIYEDKEIFARALYEQGDMSERDYKNYTALNDHMASFLKAPDLMIYLKKSVPKLLENIQKRNRDFESNIPIDYLNRLNGYYDEWIKSYKKGKVITIESDSLDFVQNRKDFEFIVDQIENALPQPTLFHPPHEVSSHDIFIETHESPKQPRLF